ncbi:SGNH/GDSL hydrolase family protein [Alcaligenes endophyticus]|uniref:SGNH/GDSL hydrolase family protein n=2 Tax=Alcaligenes endophyticus TaxID=1929088 RepID=A0ABT8EES4_9BURK|nr:SGNH/GDSL hydrolase family protein [Alcaligenes endophyticus]MCX5592341.1 SGNH/GDSL hydrolase family protein [Alcaligenes endophyticus]MDN4119784.1 SGNH/GDSL hydrolase family protein [Alcaligenes endophyticus]
MTILMIGDSHLTNRNYLIDTLHTALQEKGAHVHTFGVCGTNAGDWLKATPGKCGAAERIEGNRLSILANDTATKPITSLISQIKPDVVIVVMGDAMAGYDKNVFPKAWAWKDVTTLTKEIASTNTQCVWVGPAWGTEGGRYQKTFKRVQEVSDFLQDNVAPCQYIDSLRLSKPGEWATTDGQHFTASGYAKWGAAIAQQLTIDLEKK